MISSLSFMLLKTQSCLSSVVLIINVVLTLGSLRHQRQLWLFFLWQLVFEPSSSESTSPLYSQIIQSATIINHNVFFPKGGCQNVPTCSSVMEMVGNVFILSLSAGGGPVFSNWFSNYMWKKSREYFYNISHTTALYIVFFCANCSTCVMISSSPLAPQA